MMTTLTLSQILSRPTPNKSKTHYLDELLCYLYGEPDSNNSYLQEVDDLQDFISNSLEEIIHHYKNLDIISLETGEILHQINLQEDTLEEIPTFKEEVEVMVGEENPHFSFRRYWEWKKSLDYLTGHPFRMKNMITYVKGGVRMHCPPLFGIASEADPQLWAMFVDLHGYVTDKFFGSCNDFTDWFNSKASKGDKFNLLVWDGEIGKHINVGKVRTWLGSNEKGESAIIRQKYDGSWELESYINEEGKVA